MHYSEGCIGQLTQDGVCRKAVSWRRREEDVHALFGGVGSLTLISGCSMSSLLTRYHTSSYFTSCMHACTGKLDLLPSHEG